MRTEKLFPAIRAKQQEKFKDCLCRQSFKNFVLYPAEPNLKQRLCPCESRVRLSHVVLDSIYLERTLGFLHREVRSRCCKPKGYKNNAFYVGHVQCPKLSPPSTSGEFSPRCSRL